MLMMPIFAADDMIPCRVLPRYAATPICMILLNFRCFDIYAAATLSRCCAIFSLSATRRADTPLTLMPDVAAVRFAFRSPCRMPFDDVYFFFHDGFAAACRLPFRLPLVVRLFTLMSVALPI